MRVKASEYMDKVLDELESINYPELVLGFSPEDIGKALAGTVKSNWELGISPKMCSIIIWSMTMNYQILNRVKH